jgi:hypothetical protein
MEHELREERVVPEVDDVDVLELRSERPDRLEGQLVRQRTLRRHPGDHTADLASLGGADHDREAARSALLLEEDELLLRALADHDPREGDVDHLRVVLGVLHREVFDPRAFS